VILLPPKDAEVQITCSSLYIHYNDQYFSIKDIYIMCHAIILYDEPNLREYLTSCKLFLLKRYSTKLNMADDVRFQVSAAEFMKV
jgi:hypothetical protein